MKQLMKKQKENKKMAKYRKKPVVIEAWKITNDNIKDLTKEGIIRYCTNYDKKQWLEVVTLEGVMKANVGEYLIKGVQGEYYPCKADIFEATYEEVKGEDEE